MSHTLPPRPSLDQLRHQAKDVVKAHRAGDAEGCAVLRQLPRLASADDRQLLAAAVKLNDAQFALARDYGFETWAALKRHVNAVAASQGVQREDGRTWIEGVPELRWGGSGECTFAGALSAALAVTSRPAGYSDLMGWSGLAFRVRWFRRFDEPWWCPSSPVGEFSQEIYATAGVIGWEVDQASRMGQDNQDMAFCAPALRKSIDAGLPVVGYPDSDLNVAVAYGYEETDGQTTFLWNAYGRNALAVPAARVGPWQMILRKQGKPMAPRDAMVEGLSTENWRRRRSGDWRNVPGQDAAYLYGPDALRTWRDDIRQAQTFAPESRKRLAFVSWWCLDCLLDARMAAARFLREHAGDLGTEAEPALLRAAEAYGEEAAFLRKAWDDKAIFLNPRRLDEWTEPVRERECQVLQRMLALDEDAIRSIDEALAAS
jgi:hypothetical protein